MTTTDRCDGENYKLLMWNCLRISRTKNY